LALDARGVDHQNITTLGDHRLHLVHLDDRVFVRALEQQLESLLLGDLFRPHLHSGEVRCLELLLGEAHHDVLDVALRPVCRLRRRIDLPAPRQSEDACRQSGRNAQTQFALSLG
jgi:hypothetical protein